MKLQVAIDRVDMQRAQRLIHEVEHDADLIEIGTSLTKEFGLVELQRLKSQAPLLGDIKTCDEGAYEFKLGFASGFQYLTVMGSSSMGTLETCAKITAEQHGGMMIDLLECDDARISRISGFSEAIYCLHMSKDSGSMDDPVGQIRSFRQRFPQIAHIAIAGGIKQHQLQAISKEGIDIVIMGSAITGADDIQQTCHQCKGEIQ
ncbi:MULTISPECIES: orotidine 5'-phosphate decarboxylase / HUMPS family protein [Bifidobacterium]|jgi:3-hexulose-6-phosphate synthase|uniref:3-hexulose-6-phosphate synthase n=1 Tax=Bifidobacterium tibiigranuli TaxID=2172043 RepID=A0A5N6S1R8_9BIFI|nr:orotidine 5'-phosphate decarboxylase / HUMPS family protein [Bifidobacterium tibiigranuli]KAE8127383.1 3-hexulose-6-phosphate synthase [Bifidobacterium tibiigranuli]KAE8129774.1 3-hexulose-6-phosphate synthase [Bifidobacterium tibiigranuli]MCI1212269.1 orotidine 5'-phosphate decarboxylase [Bifidobacterium tibiigranuli]MCI1221518.1 orotidine 5'-phosphate decarboxylase [Bifidobacterium tibiigranuli]